MDTTKPNPAPITGLTDEHVRLMAPGIASALARARDAMSEVRARQAATGTEQKREAA